MAKRKSDGNRSNEEAVAYPSPVEGTTCGTVSGRKIHTASDIVDIIRPMIAHPTQEEVFAVSLDRRLKVKEAKLMALGTDTEAAIPVKHIIRDAIMALASGVVLVHTHPSGETSPSRQDDEVTGRLDKALDLMGMRLLDHIIIGGDSYYSYSEENKIICVNVK